MGKILGKSCCYVGAARQSALGAQRPNLTAAALLTQSAQPLFSRKISGKLVIITKISRLINHLLPQSRMWLQKYHPSGRLA